MRNSTMIKVMSLVISLFLLVATNSFAITAPGTASADSDWSSCPAGAGNFNYVAAKAFDRNTSTAWHTGCYKITDCTQPGGCYSYYNGLKTGIIQYEFSLNKLIDHYSILPSSEHNLSYTPKSWTFEAWNGTSWIVLDTRSNITGWTYGNYQSFSFKNMQSYRMYRLKVTANSGGGHLAIGEITMLGTIYN